MNRSAPSPATLASKALRLYIVDAIGLCPVRIPAGRVPKMDDLDALPLVVDSIGKCEQGCAGRSEHREPLMKRRRCAETYPTIRRD
jgi:hypothetical protein